MLLVTARPGGAEDVEFRGVARRVLNALSGSDIALEFLRPPTFEALEERLKRANAEGNPFVEYAIAPTNILDEGAVGVFAGYNLTEKTIEIDF